MTTPLRRARDQKGETTRVVASAVNIDQSQYVRVELGKKRASPELADRLEKYFGVRVVNRDQILYPEDYIDAGPRKPAHQSPELAQAS